MPMNAPSKRYRHDQGRNQRGTDVLQEHQHHQEYQHHRTGERVHDLADGHGDELGGIERGDPGDARRKAALQLIHAIAYGLHHFQDIGPGQHRDAAAGDGLAVHLVIQAVGVGCQLQACDITQAHGGAVRIRAQNDVLELVL